MKYFAVIFLLAGFLRLSFLPVHPPGLYWDEYDTGYQAYSLLRTGRDYFGNLFPAHLQSFADYRSGLYMYFTVPLVKGLGLSAFSLRLTAVVFSLLSLFFTYYLARKFFNFGSLSWLPVMVMAFAPWLLIQGRIAAESTLVVPFLLLGLIGFFEYITCHRWLWLAALGFGLTLWSYGTAKIFLPLFLLVLIFIYFKLILNLKLQIKNYLIPLILFIAICAPVVVETFTKPVTKRMSELSVFTDPTTSANIDFDRLEAALGAGKPRQVGMAPSLLEKVVFNKITYWGGKIVANYASALSTGFLFTKGDPELRHNLNQFNTGQFYLVELIPFILGLYFILKSYFINHKSKLLLFWFLLAPLPSIITRDGGNHAPRLLFLFPVVVLIISYGLKYLSRNKFIFLGYLLIYLFTITITIYYFFTTYRSTSASHFNSGFSEAVSWALKNQNLYDRVIIDTHNENVLMAYLFTTAFKPEIFQKSFPLPAVDLTAGLSGYSFGNMVLLYPGTRSWNHLRLPGKNLIIAAADEPDLDFATPLKVIRNPDSTPAFKVFAGY